MSKYLVVVMDGTKARFLTLKPVDFPEHESGPDLIERDGLTDEAKGMHGSELWANVQTGRNRGSNSRGHTYDDRRQNHIVEFERRFAHAIVDKIVQFEQAEGIRRLIAIAEPQILGIVRGLLPTALTNRLQIHDIAKDLCHLKPHEIQEYLAKKSLLPARNAVTRA
ncbi:host attachment protein [Synechococcus sp. PCC 7336]|uniref:host attachment protein n=1 Tax=Synechococcus sp. PCC 7336 TaxID=195250 RepID=UPI000345E117|nr:host attachment protein [Synechococcus sp. PCC 7336]